MNHKLRLLDTEEPTAAEVYRARVEQGWREWSGPQGQPWQPFSEPQQLPTLAVDDVQRRSYKVIVVDSPIPFWRKVMRWLR